MGTFAYNAEFKVVSISSNANSFGLNGVIFVSKDGECYEAACYLPVKGIEVGSVVEIPTFKLNDGKAYRHGFSEAGYELPVYLGYTTESARRAAWE